RLTAVTLSGLSNACASSHPVSSSAKREGSRRVQNSRRILQSIAAPLFYPARPANNEGTRSHAGRKQFQKQTVRAIGISAFVGISTRADHFLPLDKSAPNRIEGKCFIGSQGARDESADHRRSRRQRRGDRAPDGAGRLAAGLAGQPNGSDFDG